MHFFKSNIYILTYSKHLDPIRNEKYALTNIIQQHFLTN
jgi:hypothetical protein